MIGMELVKEFVECVLLTGRLKTDEAPVGSLLIASPESGKTSLVLESQYASAIDITDATGRGITEILKYKPEVSHLIFNDLTAIMAHGKTVRAYTVAMINSMTEEGIRMIAFPNSVEPFKNGKRGIIACLTPAMILDGRQWWNKIGLTTRLLPFFYQHSTDLVLKIKTTIDNGDKLKKPDVLPFPKMPIDVRIDKHEAKLIREIADGVSRRLGDDTGYRRLKQMRKMAQAHVLWRRQWKNAVVKSSDIEFLHRIALYISYTGAGEI